MRDTNEHAPSYYAATRNYSKDYPTLRGEQHADVVVVGGGFTGKEFMEFSCQLQLLQKIIY